MSPSDLVARLRRDDSWALDLLLALAFMLVAGVDVLTLDAREGPAVPNLALVAVAAAGFAWRRRAPLAAVAVSMSAAVVLSAWWTPVDEMLGSLLLLLVPAYSVAAWSDQRRALAGLALCLAGPAAVNVLAGNPVADYLFTSLLVGVSWFSGRAIRGRRLLAAALSEKARRLEAEREDRARLAVADERTRIARELHAVVADSVSEMVVQAAAAQRLLDDPDRAEPAIAVIEGTGREALGEMRRILGVLRREGEAAERAPQPGLGRLPALIEEGRAAGLDISLRVEGEPVPLSPGVDLAAYRVCQGAMEDVRRHAPGARSGVVVRFREHDVEVELWDDGHQRIGGESASAMRDWVAGYGIDATWGPRPEGGYEIRLTLPKAYEAVGA